MNDIVSRLAQEGLLDTDSAVQVRDALSGGKSLDEALRTPKSASEDKILRLLAEEFGIPFVDLEKDADKYIPTKELLAKLPARILIDHRLIEPADRGVGCGQGCLRINHRRLVR